MKFNIKNVTQLDAQEQVFLRNELEKIIEELYAVEYPARNVRSLIPVDHSDGAGTKKIIYRMYDKVGIAKWINNYATDWEKVDVKFTEHEAKVKSFGAECSWNFQEVREARQANKPLETLRAEAVREAIMTKEQKIALFGDTDYAIYGLFNNPNTPSLTFTADGSGSSTLWANKSPEKILRDLNALVSQPYLNTKGIRSANTLLLPHTQYSLIKRTPYNSTLSPRSILDVFLDMNPEIVEVYGMWELDATQNTEINASFAFAYHKDPKVLSLRIPVDFETFLIDKVVETVMKGHESIGGVIWPYPLTACKGVGL